VNPPRSFEEVIIPYLQHARQHQRSYETTVYRVKNLRRLFAGAVMNELTGKNITHYTSTRRTDGASASTINRELAALSAAINHCNVEFEWALPNPVKGRMAREPEGRVRWLQHAEVEALCRAAGKQRHGDVLEDFIRLAVNTGCRKNELLGLEWRRVDMANRLIHLEGEHTKAGKRRSIPINAKAFAVLVRRQAYRAEHCPGSEWVFCRASGERARSIDLGFRLACASADIKDFCIHDLRHTCAAHLISAGVPLAEVRDLLGHSTVMMTERYAHLAPNRVRKAVEVLDGIVAEASEEHGVSRSRYAGNPVRLIAKERKQL
jgi:integrase